MLKRDAKNKKVDVTYWLTTLLPYLEQLNEDYISKEEILNNDQLITRGFTDTALIEVLERENITLLSKDLSLIYYCKKKGLQAFHPEEIFR